MKRVSENPSSTRNKKKRTAKKTSHEKILKKGANGGIDNSNRMLLEQQQNANLSNFAMKTTSISCNINSTANTRDERNVSFASCSSKKTESSSEIEDINTNASSSPPSSAAEIIESSSTYSSVHSSSSLVVTKVETNGSNGNNRDKRGIKCKDHFLTTSLMKSCSNRIHQRAKMNSSSSSPSCGVVLQLVPSMELETTKQQLQKNDKRNTNYRCSDVACSNMVPTVCDSKINSTYKLLIPCSPTTATTIDNQTHKSSSKQYYRQSINPHLHETKHRSVLQHSACTVIFAVYFFGYFLPFLHVIFDFPALLPQTVLEQQHRQRLVSNIVHFSTPCDRQHIGIDKSNVQENKRLDCSLPKQSICSPGAGFSGFWFSLGRLKRIETAAAVPLSSGSQFNAAQISPNGTDYYCFSAGCLSVVATLQSWTMDEVLNLAVDVQDQWKSGKIGRYHVVRNFVDRLLGLSSGNSTIDGDDLDDIMNIDSTGGLGEGTRLYDKKMNGDTLQKSKHNKYDHRQHLQQGTFSRLKIITTVRGRHNLGKGLIVEVMKTSVRTPRNIYELKEMLIQTTWIPYITGPTLWQKDSKTGDYHMDGAFTAPFHPKCTFKLGLPLRTDVIMNGLNMNLQRDEAAMLWRLGFDHEL